ncbi:4-hydroxy-tetrahydrodipicolinate synthase [Paenibacillus sp. IB182496]|uniref:4-hydroxy-tetrahydrodipicolinate synthase n=1 Tax=Paenibacillus sabuli TaxID=2772509 RepID=A0A927BT69_9BACL|nr:4-hydroxy-tetrahydrodipicolinate synthase [Paenibacillus sabuli]MBD2845230.1 4-hydroxy-tetrahydrodipicolinate synthase [Paenibacillus sabuli]
MDFGRLVTAMVTPFDAGGKIDWEAAERLIDYLIEEQLSDSLVIAGTTGESPTLSDAEKLELFRFAVKQAKGRCKIIAGTGSNNTAHSIHLTHEAEGTGVDAILLVAPYYSRPSQEGLYQHLKLTAEATKLPIMLYNVPSRTSVNISSQTTLRLADLPNVVATKDCGSLDQLTEIIRDAPEGFDVYSGDDSDTLPIMSIGGRGVVSVASHIVGKQMKQMIEAFVSGRLQEASRMHCDLSVVIKSLFDCPHPVPNPVPVKHALALCGVPVGGVRLPLVGLTDSEAAYLASRLTSLNG